MHACECGGPRERGSGSRGRVPGACWEGGGSVLAVRVVRAQVQAVCVRRVQMWRVMLVV